MIFVLSIIEILYGAYAEYLVAGALLDQEKCSTDIVPLFVYTDVFVRISQIYQNNSQKVMYIFVYFIVFLYLCTRFGICALNRRELNIFKGLYYE